MDLERKRDELAREYKNVMESSDFIADEEEYETSEQKQAREEAAAAAQKKAGDLLEQIKAIDFQMLSPRQQLRKQIEDQIAEEEGE